MSGENIQIDLLRLRPNGSQDIIQIKGTIFNSNLEPYMMAEMLLDTEQAINAAMTIRAHISIKGG